MKILAAFGLVLALWAVNFEAIGRPFKDREGFTSEWIAGRGPGVPVETVILGNSAIFWLTVHDLVIGQRYKVACVVKNSRGDVIHEEKSAHSARASMEYMSCPITPQATGAYTFTYSVDDEPIAESAINVERRILGLKPFVFVSIFVVLLLAALGLRALRKKD